MKRKRTSGADRWFPVPRELIRRHALLLGANGIAVYATLSAYAKEDNIARLTYKKIHKKLGLTNAETVKSLHLLEELHIIRAEGKKAQEYKLLWVPAWGKPGEKEGEKLGKQQKNRHSPYRFDNRIERIIDLIISIIDTLKRKTLTLTHIMENDYEDIEYEDEGDMEPPQDEEGLAYELAEALNDTDALPMYLSYVHRFPESLLRETLVKVLAVPAEKVIKSRGALFNFLVQQYAAKKKHYPRN